MAQNPKKEKFYMGNPNVPSKGAEFEYTPKMVKEIDKCKNDILHFAENYFFILIPGKGKEKIKLYKAQKRILKKMRNNPYFILLASRQVGKSTLMTIYLLWVAMFFNDNKILLVANKESTAIEIFTRIRMAYELMPNWIKSPIDEGFGGYGKTSMGLENGSRIEISTTTGTAARGKACNILVIDEAAFIEQHLMDPFWASVFPIVSSIPDGKIFICSTPNGTGNLFHELYSGSLEGKNGWVNDKIIWNEVPGRTETWAKKIRSGLASEEKWRQEYECEFINSGTSSLDEDLYKRLRGELREPKEILMDGKYKIWDLPNPDRIYVAGVDVGEGVGGDYSVIKIVDITDLDEIIEVAEYYSNDTPVSEFSNIVYDILQHWGNPLVCVERNNQGGQVADRLGNDYGYPKMVNWGSKLAGRKNLELFGMVSSRNTKYYACANARYYYNDKGAVIFRNEDSLEELFKHFVKLPNDSWGAISGKHDDRTMALIWALMVLDKDLCERWFTIEETDSCGKPKKITPLDLGISYFENATSIYSNEKVERIEQSRLAPIVFGGGTEQMNEIEQLKADGWELLQGTMPHIDQSRTFTPDQWDAMKRIFG
jgi:hypothetical protein